MVSFNVKEDEGGRCVLSLDVSLPGDDPETQQNSFGLVHMTIMPSAPPFAWETSVGMSIETAKMFRSCLDIQIAFLERNPRV